MAWQVMYRNADGQKKRHTFNTYPAMSLVDARDEAKDLFRKIAKGGDPAADKKAKRRAGTFNELTHLYIEKYAKLNKASWEKDEAIINRNLKPAWGTRKAASITRRDVNKLLNEIVERGAPIQANRVLEIIRKMYSWAIGSDRVELDVNPCHEVKKPSKERRRDRVLDAEEIKALWPMAGEDARITEPSRLTLRLVLVTAQRPGEVAGLAWNELDYDWETSEEPFWTIPGDRTKNRQAHRVPLSPLAVVLLKEAKVLAGDDSGLAFPSPRSRQKMEIDDRPTSKPILVNSLSHALIRSGHFGIEHFVPHDLRRTASTHMTGPQCGVSRFILERVLNHADQTVTGRHYDLYHYDAEKRVALNAWSRRLKDILAGKKKTDGADVIELQAVR